MDVFVELQILKRLARHLGATGPFDMPSELEKFGRYSYEWMFHREPPANLESETLKLFGRIILRLITDPPKYAEDNLEDHQSLPRLSLPIIRPPEKCQTKTAQAFPYEKLPTATSIRLVSIKPLEIHTIFDLFQPIECSIVVVDLKDSPAFDAVSYTWGDPSTVFDSERQVSCREDWAAPAFEILLDGKPVSVSTNLYTMLLALRRTSSDPERAFDDISFTKRFWIDALCINQAEIDEKAQQIMMMSRIYNCATCVFIWLGGQDHETGRVLQHLKNLTNLDKERIPLLDPFIVEVDMYKKLGIPAISADDWVGIYKFYNRTWFSRAWIVQEVGLAKQTVGICGLYMFRCHVLRLSLARLSSAGCIRPLRDLVERLIYGARNENQHSKTSYRKNLTKRRIFQPSAPNTPFNPNLFILMQEEGFAIGGTAYMAKIKTGIRPKPLWRIVHRFGGLQASNPRDKVYAFMGLSREHVEEGRQLVPKYGQPVEEVYLEAVRFMAGSVGGLNFLGMKELVPSSELPSWMPDFNASSSFISYVETLGIWSCASDGLNPRSFHINKKKLSVSGICCGKVLRKESYSPVNVGAIIEILEGLPETSDIWKPPVGTEWEVGDVNCAQGIHKTAKRGWTLTHQRRYEVLWRTLVSDSFDGEQPAPMNCEKLMDAYVQYSVTQALVPAICGLARNQEELDFLWQFFQASDFQAPRSLHRYDRTRTILKEAYLAQQMFLGHVQPDTRDSDLPPTFQRYERIRNTHGVKSQEFLTFFAQFGHHYQSQIDEQNSNVHTSFRQQIEMVGKVPRVLFTTDRGHLGHAKGTVQKDDEIWVLAGASIPFILRPVDEATYRLISDAYVHGIMYGEGVPDGSSDLAREISSI
ncbi:unnamed protein product [Clonostachys byssicola]|uniref:Heterokaryon incompatibility domain-containing protein n=1 Tax=Clonostachys byssicola TaxID=160290 RepID=A0A9N9XZ29_9HYPO|nr:unnamed protein product [Clonostachys byssicola]